MYKMQAPEIVSARVVLVLSPINTSLLIILLLLFTIFDGLLFLSESKIGFSIYLKYSDTSYYMGLNVGVNSVFDVKQVVESKPLAFTNGF